MNKLTIFCCFTLFLVISIAEEVDVTVQDNSVDSGEKQVIVENHNDPDTTVEEGSNRITSDVGKESRSFVWKTLINRNELVYEDMILGTYEQNTANDYMIYAFFGRLVFADNFKLMAKVIPTSSMQFFSTLGENNQQTNDLKYQTGVETNGTNFNLDHFEILTNPHKTPYKWIKSETVPANPVVCSEELGQVFYCGRMQVLDKGLMPAKISNGLAYSHYFIVRTSSDFEYLVYDHEDHEIIMNI